jgi:hypothetical protein
MLENPIKEYDMLVLVYRTSHRSLFGALPN